MPPAPASNGCSQPKRPAPKWAAPIPSHPKSHNHCAEVLGHRPECAGSMQRHRPPLSALCAVSATYGLNCKDFSVPAPFPNLAKLGNVTRPVERECNSRERCNFLVDITRIGDPANGCGKDFSVEYRCTGSDPVKSVFLPPEAQGKSVILDCTAAK